MSEQQQAGPVAAQSRASLPAATAPEDHPARERIQRVMYISIGIGAVVFAGLRVGQIQDQSEGLVAGYALIAILVGALMPASLALVPLFVPARAVHAYAKAIPIAFFVVHATWLPFMTVERMAAGPWLQAVNAIPVLIAAVAFRHRWVWGYVFVQLPLVAVTERLTTGGAWIEGALSGVLSVLFSGLIAGVGLALVKAGDAQDAAAAQARQVAAREAAGRTRSREQTRINSIVFDEVMTAMGRAATEPLSPSVVATAQSALQRIQTLGEGESERTDYSPEELLAVLRAAAGDTSGQIEFWHRQTGNRRLPAEVVDALSEATAEAVRNSLRHASPDGRVVTRVVNVALADDSVQVNVEDSGVGFDVRAVSERKLGLRVSVMDRMVRVPGGSAHVDSRPGRGTIVALRWVRAS